MLHTLTQVCIFDSIGLYYEAIFSRLITFIPCRASLKGTEGPDRKDARFAKSLFDLGLGISCDIRVYGTVVAVVSPTLGAPPVF